MTEKVTYRACRIDEASEACIDQAVQRAQDVATDMAHWLNRWPGGAPNEAWSALSALIAELTRAYRAAPPAGSSQD